MTSSDWQNVLECMYSRAFADDNNCPFQDKVNTLEAAYILLGMTNEVIPILKLAK